MSSVSKIAVSLSPALIARVRSAVKSGRARSVSAYVADALAEKSKLDDLAEMLSTMLAETGGPLSHSERLNADQALDSRKKSKPRRP